MNQKLISTCSYLLVGLMFILLLVSPAIAAGDYELEAKWADGSSGSKTFTPAATDTLSYTVTLTGAAVSNVYFIADISNLDSESGVGFKFSGYPNDDIVIGGMTIVEIVSTNYDRNNGKLILQLHDPGAQFTIDLIVEAEARSAYNGENNKISAGIYVDDGSGGYTSISDTSDVSVVCNYPNFVSNAIIQLTNPSAMPSGASHIDARYVFYTESDWTSLQSGNGFQMKFDSLTLDFSNVLINDTASGVSSSYSALVAAGTSPVTFGVASSPNSRYTSELSADGMSITFTPVGSFDYYSWKQLFDFSIETTSDFSAPAGIRPSIDFRPLTASTDMKYNGRGPDFDFINYMSGPVPTPIAHRVTSILNGSISTSSHLEASFLPGAGGTSYILANSENYGLSSPFYYQELIKLSLRSTLHNGADEVIRLDVPNGVTITHIRVPSIKAGDIQYSAIRLQTPGGPILLADSSLTGSGRTVNLSSIGVTLSSGEDIVLEIDDLVFINYATSGQSGYSADYSISFIGTTDSSVGSTITTLPFIVYDYVDGASGDIWLAANTQSITTNYVVSPYVTNNHGFLSAAGVLQNNPPGVLNRGDTFYMFTTFHASTYPYYSAVRMSPENPTGLYSSPVIFFSIPPGFTVEPNSVQVVNAAGNPVATFRDMNNQDLKLVQTEHDNMGLYPGGKLIEVRFEYFDGSPGPVWVNTTSYSVRLPVTVPADYSGSLSVNLNEKSVLVSSWDTNVNYSATGGAAGRNYNIVSSAFNNDNYGNLYGSYPQNLLPSRIAISNEKTVISAVGVKVGSSFSYFNPGNSASYPSLKAGSSNEQFKIHFFNNHGNAVGSTSAPSELYFVLPASTSGKALLTNVSSFSNIVTTGTVNYKIYYSTNVTSNIGGYVLSDMTDPVQFTWTEITNPAAVDWEQITAIRCSFENVADESSFDFQLPFRLPSVSEGAVYDQAIRGQTLYSITKTDGSSFMLSNNGFTGAFSLSKSDLPDIFTDSGSGKTAFSASYNVAYGDSSAIPTWYNVILQDDFSQVTLSSVEIKFKNLQNVETAVAFDKDTFFSSTVYPAEPGYVAGVNYTNASGQNPETYISAGNVGTYTVTYKTTQDGDLQDHSVSISINVAKADSTISLTNGPHQYLFMNDAEPSGGWNASFLLLVSGTDIDGTGASFPIPSGSFVPHTDTDLNVLIPGIYKVVYSYTDVALNTKKVEVPVTVKYVNELVLNATSGISPGTILPVEDLTGTVSFSGSGSPVAFVYDAGEGGYVSTLRAADGNPRVIDYTINYAGVPKGLVDSNSGAVSGSIDYAVSGTNPKVHDLSFAPVKMSVTIDTVTQEGLENIVLFKQLPSGDSEIQTITRSEISGTPIVFEKESGWFEDGDYYMTAELIPGYKLNPGFTDFSSGSSILNLNTAAFTLANSDITRSLIAEKSTLVEGTVWNDSNRDSIIDASEFGISGAVVSLYLDDGSTSPAYSTVTDLNGNYYFIDLPDNTAYIVQIQIPNGYNNASNFIAGSDQLIDKGNGFNSTSFSLVPGNLWATVNAGFYYAGSSSTGGGKVVGPNSGNDSSIVTDDRIDDNPIVDAPDIPSEQIEEPVKTSNLWWYLLLLLIICIILGFVIWYKTKNK